jgi:3-hydroxyisobutyrate dehydrogenase
MTRAQADFDFSRPADTPVGWIGAGVMGRSMCGHLLAAGHPVTLFTRTREKAEPLLESGAVWAESPAALARRSRIIFTMVGFPDDVRSVYFDADGVLAGATAGCVLIDMTTTQPSLAVEVDAAARRIGAHAIDAPVSGGDVGARNASLSIMVGGDEAVVEAVRPLLAVMGKTIVRQGGAGAGQHAKMCNQIVIAGTMIGVCEALLYARKSGLDAEVLLQSIRPGAAGCWALDNLAPRILQRNFDPGFFIEHFIKDLGIALEEARRMKLALPGLALAEQLYIAAAARGHGRCGTHGLMLALEAVSGLESPA